MTQTSVGVWLHGDLQSVIIFEVISDFGFTMKPPARNKKNPPTFKFDSTHVLGSQRVSKHREKRQERDKKRKARDETPNTPIKGATGSGSADEMETSKLDSTAAETLTDPESTVDSANNVVNKS